MPKQNVHFVRERPQKAPLCDKLGINVFIDDHLSVLACFNPSKTLRVYFKPQSHVENTNVLFYHGSILHVTDFESLTCWIENAS